MFSNSSENTPSRREKIEDQQNAIEAVLLLSTAYINLVSSGITKGKSFEVITGVEGKLIAAIERVK